MDTKYPSDGMLVDDNGKPTDTMGWIAEELTGESFEGILPYPTKRHPPPADWGPHKRNLARGKK